MTSQGRNKRSRASDVGASPIQSHSEGTSSNHSPNCEAIRFRAYEIYVERGSYPGNELDDWLQAEHELDGRAPQKRESTDRGEH